jgi:DNA polymerase I-like protein with 3'-5' exonuclease and polymerase domains
MQICDVPSRAMNPPAEFSTNLDALSRALKSATIAVFDFETDGLNPHRLAVCGLGIYLPESARTFYINCGHAQCDERVPLVAATALAEAVGPFFSNPNVTAIAHNAAYDARVLFRLGVPLAAKLICTQIRTHRCDENLNRDEVFHEHVKVTYGLKELTTVYFREQPPRLHQVTGNRNTMFASPFDVARYCVLDLHNTWRLYVRSEEQFRLDSRLRWAAETIDDLNNRLIAQLMWNGIGIDSREARRQEDAYAKAIQACREEIWARTKTDWPLRTREHLLAMLRHLQLHIDLPFDPFYEVDDGEAGPSLNSERLEWIVELCADQSKREVIALILAKRQMEQRISSFLRPFVASSAGEDRLYPSYFNSTLVTTRFSSSPNLQNLPGKADVATEEWRRHLPPACNVNLKTRRILNSERGRLLVQLDYKSAEPRYMGLLFQRALQQKDDYFLAAKSRLQSARWEKYSQLMRLKGDTADEAVAYSPESITWPSYLEDPLWLVFRAGGDPYDALLQAMMPDEFEQARRAGQVDKWLKEFRHVGKRAFLALGYGSSPRSLAPQLGWTVERTESAIRSMEERYATLNPLRELTRREVVQIGHVRTLTGRPRRLNGYYELVQPGRVRISYQLQRPTPREYEMDIIPLGPTQYGIQAFIQHAKRRSRSGGNWSVILDASKDGKIKHIDERDAFIRNVREHHFNNPPFANISFSRVTRVKDSHGLTRHLARLEDATRQAFNSLCQSTGADHLRQAMNGIDAEVVARPEFGDARLVLTVHDSIIYEVPAAIAESFARAAKAVMSRRPEWSTLDFPVEVEIGRNLGEMSSLKDEAHQESPGRFRRILDTAKRFFNRVW